jgi:hypothetical protein
MYDRIPTDLFEKCISNDDGGKIAKIIDIINRGLFYYSIRNNLLEPLQARNKANENNTVYQNEEPGVERNYNFDRHFPLETVAIKTFNMDYDTKIEYVNIHTGPFANEYARSLNALAVTLANDIYFKDGEYKPESEKGKELLAHELTHVSQYEENRITPNTTKKELEEEAERSEKIVSKDYDPIVTVEIHGHDYKIKRSEIREIAEGAAKLTRRWLEKQKMILSEEEYMHLLYACRKNIEAF